MRRPWSWLWHPLTVVLAGALGLRLLLSPLYARLPNGTLDEGFWTHWMQRIHEDGFLNILNSSATDYVGLHWILWALAEIYALQGGPYHDSAPFLHFLVKVPFILFDLVMIAAVYFSTVYVVRVTPEPEPGGWRWPVWMRLRAPVVAAAVAAVHPAVVYDSAVWAQSDGAISAAMLGSLVLAHRGRAGWAGAVFGLGFALKPHPVVIGPLLLLVLWRSTGRQGLLRAAAGVAAVMLVVLGPWLLAGEAANIGRAYERMFFPERMRLSELAWNTWWIADQQGDPRPGSAVVEGFGLLTWQALAFALSAASAGVAFAYAWTRREIVPVLIAASYQAFAFYQLPIGAHERYLFPFLVLLLPVVMVRPRWSLLYGAVSVTFFLNLFMVAPPRVEWMDRWVYGGFGQWVSAANVVLFGTMTFVLATQLVLGRSGRRVAG